MSSLIGWKIFQHKAILGDKYIYYRSEVPNLRLNTTIMYIEMWGHVFGWNSLSTIEYSYPLYSSSSFNFSLSSFTNGYSSIILKYCSFLVNGFSLTTSCSSFSTIVNW